MRAGIGRHPRGAAPPSWLLFLVPLAAPAGVASPPQGADAQDEPTPRVIA